MPMSSLKVLNSLSRVQKLFLLALSITYISMSLPMINTIPFLPAEAKTHNVSATLTGAMFSSAALATVISSLFIGMLIVEIGPKSVLLLGVILNGLFSTLLGLTTNLEGLWFVVSCFACLTFSSFGIAAITTSTYTYAAKMFPNNMGIIVGTLETYYAISEVITFPLGAVLFDWGGFQLPFIFFGLLHLVAFPIDVFLMPSDRKTKGSEIFQLSLNPTNALNLNQQHREENSKAEKVKIEENGQLLVCDQVIENKCTDEKHQELSIQLNEKPVGKLKPWHLLLIPRTMLMALILFVTGICWAFINSTLEPHLSPLGLSTAEKNGIFLLTSIIYGLSSPLWGCIADRLSGCSWILMSTGLIIAGISFAFLGPLPILGLTNSVWLNIVSLSVITTTLAMAGVPAVEAALLYTIEAGHKDDVQTYAIVSSLIATTYSGGTVVGPLLGGFLLDQVGFEWSAGVCGICCLFYGTVIIIYFLIFYKPDIRSNSAGESLTFREALRKNSISRGNSVHGPHHDHQRQSISDSLLKARIPPPNFALGTSLDSVLLKK